MLKHYNYVIMETLNEHVCNFNMEYFLNNQNGTSAHIDVFKHISLLIVVSFLSATYYIKRNPRYFKSAWWLFEENLLPYLKAIKKFIKTCKEVQPAPFTGTNL
uniref:PiggyBac transposable element-derived protein domain-containing protein n=1 Tax=Photinus pyralis TaxID=7054 RepID=A0A1Y1KNN2_PHOPY